MANDSDTDRRPTRDEQGVSGARGQPVEPGLPPVGGPFVSLRSRDFRLLWFSTVATGFGQWGQQIGLNWLVFLLTGSAVQLGAVSFFGGIISLILTPYAGVLADRYSRRMIILIATVLGAVQAAGLAVLVLADVVEVWHAYVFAVFAAVTQAMNQPARQAYVNDVSTPETLPNAIALNSIAQNASRIVGPPLAGLIAGWNVGAAFVFVAVIRVIASGLTMMLSARPQAATAGRGNPLRLIAGGFDYLFREGNLRLLLVVNALTALFVYPYVSFMPVFAEEVFRGGSSTYGILVSMIAVGSIIGLFGLAWLPNLRRRGLLMLVGFVGYTALLIVFTQAPVLIVAMISLAVAGLFFGVASALNNTLFQVIVRNDMRGRGMAVLQLAGGLSPIGALSMGFLIEAIGIRLGVALHIAVAFAGLVLVLVFGKAIRRL
ncbi:MAG: MFS transporter [Dehalococcoidia bacterium]|nr:MFS transporter [Dehalococcoidia bacterium]